MKSISSWANQHQTLVTCGVALVCTLLGVLLTPLFNGPTFFPTSVVLTDSEEKPINRQELSSEARACDSAVRSMLLAFVSDDGPEELDQLNIVERANATVQSPFAIIPDECRSQIDDDFVISAGGITAELKSARLTGNKIEIAFALKNDTNGARRFSISRSNQPEVKVGMGNVLSTNTSGLNICYYCFRSDFDDATQVDSGRSVLVHIEALVSASDEFESATIIVPVVRWWNRDSKQEVMLAFNDIPLQKVANAQEVSLP